MPGNSGAKIRYFPALYKFFFRSGKRRQKLAGRRIQSGLDCQKPLSLLIFGTEASVLFLTPNPGRLRMQPIQTPHLDLFPASFPALDAIVSEDWPALSRQLKGASLADSWTHFPEAISWMRDYLLEHPDELGWWSYLILHRADHRLIGTCGFKGRPSPDECVEIGYEIAPAYQGRGLATEVARALVDYAFKNAAAQTVMAHTLAEENASVPVLRKRNFVFVKEIVDPEDGPVWQWQLTRGG